MNELIRSLLATLPILLFVVLLSGLRQKAWVAACSAGILATVLALVPFATSPALLLPQAFKGLWNGATIFLVILPAMLIYEITAGADMFSHIRNKIKQEICHETLRVLMVGLAFTSFLQSITGFGVPVAVAAPILVSLGLSPVTSVLIAILGHAWGGTFGTLAVAWDALLSQALVQGEEATRQIALYTCIMLLTYTMLCAVIICFLYKGKRTQLSDILLALLVAGIQGGIQLFVAQFNTGVACFVGSAGAIVFILLLDRILFKGKREKKQPDAAPVIAVLFPYVALFCLVVVLLFIPSVYHFISSFKLGPMIEGSIYAPISIFTHSGSILFFAAFLSMTYYIKKGYLQTNVAKEGVLRALQKSLQAICPILCLIIMSKIMDGSGQLNALASGIASLFQHSYLFFSPFIGILGSFLSSSNMSSNILFGGLQQNIAHILNLDYRVVLAAQTTGGSVGNLIATSNIVLGLMTTGQSGREHEVFKIMMPICLALGTVIGLLAIIFCS